MNPSFAFEKKLYSEGYTTIVGVDEAGVGAVAGPLVAAAIHLPLNSRLALLDDSKKLTKKSRETLYVALTNLTPNWAVGIATVEEIFTLGLRPANLLAMRRAVEGIAGADFALVDAWTITNLHIPQNGIVHGDAKVKSIAAASVIAKVTRDRMMEELHELFPQYDFSSHKGYGTAKHRSLIAQHGACAAHRMNYKWFTQEV